MTSVQLEGAKSGTALLVEKQAKAELLEVASQMDMPGEPSVEIPTPSRDIKNQQAIVNNELKTAEITRRQQITEKRRANAAYARQRKAEIRRIRQESGATAAKGTPAPDILTEFSKKIMDRMDSFDKKINESLKGLPMRYAQENNPDATTKPVMPREAPDLENDLVAPTPFVRLNTVIPTATYAPPPNAYDRVQKKQVQRYKQMFDNIDFTPKPVESTRPINGNQSTFFF